MPYTLNDVAPHQIPLVRFKTEAPDASKLKANSVILDSFSVSGKTYFKIAIDEVLKSPIEEVESTIAALKGNPSVDFDSLAKIEGKITGIQTILNSNNINLDTLQEVVTFIKNVETELRNILVNDLTTGGTTKALTAEMGKDLKVMVDALTSIVGTFIADTTANFATVNARIDGLLTPYEI
jgi:hypothetical protein